jgi:UBX domain-containing protein 1
MLRIQLPDGTRLPARFNTNQTVGDVYEFIQRSSPATNAREWVLSTTFPNQEHENKGLVLGEMAEFKRGGTAVVKWK